MSCCKTLVVAPNWVGDTILGLPVLEALAASKREVHALARPHLAPLLEMSPAVASVIERSRSSGATIREIRSLEADEAVILPNSFRSAWLTYRAGIPQRWGYRGDLRRLLLRPAVTRTRQARGELKSHQISDYETLLREMNLQQPASPTPHLEPSQALRRKATEIRAAIGSRASDRSLIGLFPGAEFGPSKRWPVDHFAHLAQRLCELDSAPIVVIISGPREVALAQSISRKSGSEIPSLGSDLDLAALAAVLESLDLLVTNDSGPMHLAAAVGTRCVALFGPTDPLRTSPLGSGHRVLSTGRWCSPCFRKRCPLIHHRCLRDIPVERVLEACCRSLERSSPA